MVELEVKENSIYGGAPRTERGRGVHLSVSKDDKPRIAYGNQHFVIVKELDEPKNCVYFTEHGYRVNVASFASNGWVASGDNAGHVFVWGGRSLIPKQTFQMGKEIYDIRWDGDNQRLCIGGKGEKERFRTTSWNTSESSSTGLIGFSGDVLSCDYRPKRPLFAIVASEDPAVTITKKGGPPFELGKTQKPHIGYIPCIRYHPSGDFFVSVGADKKIIVYDGKTGEIKQEICSGKKQDIKKLKHHKGSIYAVSFNKDGSKFATCSADKTVKIWDFKEGKLLSSHQPKKGKLGVDDMQVGCVFVDDRVVSLSLNGQLNFYKEGKKLPVKVQAGHQSSIARIEYFVTGKDDSGKETAVAYTGGSDGRLCATNLTTGECQLFDGEALTGINQTAISHDGSIFMTYELSGKLRFHSTKDMKVSDVNMLEGKKGAPRGLGVSKKSAVCAALNHKKQLEVFKDYKPWYSLETKHESKAMTMSPDGKAIVMSGVGDDKKKLYFYNTEEEAKAEPKEVTIETKEEVFRLRYSKCGGFLLAICDGGVNVYDTTGDYSKPCNEDGCRGYQKYLMDADISSNNTLVMAGTECSLSFWPNIDKNGTDHTGVKLAHKLGITNVRWINDTTLLSCSVDSSIKLWDVSPKA